MSKKTQRKAQKLLKIAANELFHVSYELLEEATYLFYYEPKEIHAEDLKEIFRVHDEVIHIYTTIK